LTRTDTYTADPDGRTWTAYGRLSYADWDFSGLAFTPYVAANYVDQKLEAYDEKGSGGGALSVDEDKNWNVLTYVGSTFSAEVPLTESASVLPKLDIAWVHLMKDGERDVTTTFVGGTDSFAATIAGADQDFARVEASLGLSLDGGLAMRVDYATELGNSDVEKLHEVRLEATYQF
jgi:outer membrane autotransporter protein